MPKKPMTPQEEIKEGVKSYLHDVLEETAQDQSTLKGKAAKFIAETPEQTGLQAYLREAFLYEWNLLGFFGAAGAAAIAAPWALPLVIAAELTYLGTLVSVPKFRQAIDIKILKKQKASLAAGSGAPASPVRQLPEILHDLQPGAQIRFENLRTACLEMRSIAHDVGGSTTERKPDEVERILTSDLDRLLWTFLRYLISQEAMERFLTTTDEVAIEKQIEEAEAKLEMAKAEGRARLIHALEDSLATHRSRLGNYQQAEQNAEFVAVELDRIEGKIRAITEMAVNRQDPAFISNQVDSVVQSMKMTEQAISELNILTGINEEMFEPPLILEAD